MTCHLEARGKNLFSCPGQLLEAACVSWLVAPSSVIKARHTAFLWLSLHRRLSLTTAGKCSLPLRTHRIRLGPPRQSRIISPFLDA